MFNNKDKQVFLPVWRNGRLIFFTNIVLPGSARLGYFAAAVSEIGQTSLKRSGKAPITQNQLEFCQSIADDGVNLQKFFAALGAGNLDRFGDIIKQQKPPYPPDYSPLMFTCIYLDFLRQYAVDSEIIRMYDSTPAKNRFDFDRSVGIYKSLSARLQPEFAEKLIDADLASQKQLSGSSMIVANFLRECAVVKSDLGHFQEAEDFMLRAVKMHDTFDKWRCLGDFAQRAGDREKTIKYYLKAAELAPLQAPAALILGRALIEIGEFEQAREYVEQAAKMFAKPASILMDKIEAAKA